MRTAPMRVISLLAALAMPLAVPASPAAETPLAPADLARQLQQSDPPLVLDVRTPAEFADGHVPGALLIPHDQIEQRLAELDGARDREIVLYCRSGRRSLLAEDVLRAHGFRRLRQLDGSWQAWEAAALPRAESAAGEPSAPSPDDHDKDPTR